MIDTAYRPSLPDRLFRAVVTVGMACAFTFLGVAAFWLFYPYQGMLSYHATLTTPVVKQGGLLYGEISYCVDGAVPLPMRLDREIVLQNHRVSFPVVDLQYVITNRCEQKGRILGIPDYAPPGVYHLAITTSLQVNPLRVVRQTWTTGEFTVVAK